MAQKRQAKSVKSKAAGSLKDRNLSKVNPLKEQFEPTPANPVRQHKRMAGMA